MELYEDDKSKHGPDRNTIDHWGVYIPIIHSPFLHDYMGKQVGFVFYEPPIWNLLYLEGTYIHDNISLFNYLFLTTVQRLSF